MGKNMKKKSKGSIMDRIPDNYEEYLRFANDVLDISDYLFEMTVKKKNSEEIEILDKASTLLVEAMLALEIFLMILEHKNFQNRIMVKNYKRKRFLDLIHDDIREYRKNNPNKRDFSYRFLERK